MGDGSDPDRFAKVFSAGKRRSAESAFMTHFTNQSEKKKRVAFSAPFPGKIIPINLKPTVKVSFAKRFVSSCCLGTKVSIAINKAFPAFRRRRLHPTRLKEMA